MIGETLGPYRIDRELGSGGMGKVYAAVVEGRVPGLDEGSRVALKIVHPHLVEERGYRDRFLRELAVGRRIEHENVVRTLDGGEIDGQPYVVLEYVEGQTLRELRRELGRVPEDLCRHIGHEIARGLEAVHAAGIVHRDLKPGNVLITPDHVVKVMDLGLARQVDEEDGLTRTGMFVGTLNYAAPEQLRHAKDVDSRCDLYALGALLYKLATGKTPFAADTFHELVQQVRDERPRRPRRLNPQISRFFEELLLVLLSKKPADRIESACRLAELLERGEDDSWWSLKSTVLHQQTRRPTWSIRIPRDMECVGREQELAELRSAFDAAKAGDGQVVLLEGEAGIGKSRLIDELMRRLEMDGEDVNFLYGSYPPGGAATATGAFSTAYREQFGNAGCASYLSETPLLVPAFDAVLRGDAPPEDAQPLTSDSLKTVFVHATRALGRERPTVIVIDDLHFAPEEGRALFASLAAAVPDHRVLLVGTARPGLPTDWLANLQRLDHVKHREVRRLGAEDVSRLLSPLVGESLHAERLASAIAEKADGNPLFLVEILRSLRERGAISETDDGLRLTGEDGVEIEIPDTVQSLLDARLDGLDEEQRELLECAACWGFEFDGRLVAEALGVRTLPALRTFGALERQHGLVRATGGRFAFDHHAIQEHLYGRLAEAIREEYHAALAEALETRGKAVDKDPETLDGALSVDLAEHYLKGARGASAVRYLPAACAHLTKGYLHAQVVALTDRALAVPGLLVGTERAKALLRLADALDTMGRRTRHEECAREAERLAEEAGDDGVRGQAATALGAVFYRTSRHTEAEAAFRRALELAVARGDQKAEARATGNLGSVFESQGRLAEAKASFEWHLAMTREIGDRRGEATATGHLGNVFAYQGRLAEAQEHQERQLALSREIGDRLGEARATGSLGVVFSSQGRLAEAQEHYERHLAMTREIGDRRGETTATGNLGNVFVFQGRLAEAQEHQERQLALSREIGDRLAEARATGNLGSVFKSQGRPDEAKAYFERHLALSREIRYRGGEAIALVNLGPTWHALGNRVRARRALDESVALCREIGAQYPEGYGLLDLGRLEDEEGNPGEALQLTGESLALRRKIGHGDGVADSLIERGDLCRRAGDAGAARTSLDEALRLSREQGRAPQVALALTLLACLVGGDSDAAETALVEAGEAGDTPRVRWLLFRATGDRAHLEEAKRLLDESVAHVDEETRQSMLTNLRLSREIMAAWEEQGGGE